jgi:hypothetical protein
MESFAKRGQAMPSVTRASNVLLLGTGHPKEPPALGTCAANLDTMLRRGRPAVRQAGQAKPSQAKPSQAKPSQANALMCSRRGHECRDGGVLLEGKETARAKSTRPMLGLASQETLQGAPKKQTVV